MVSNGVVLTDYETYICTRDARRRAGTLTAVTLIAALASGPGCGFAVKHPAVAAGVVGGTLGLATCKLASDDIGACLAVGGGAGAFLGLVAAAALWLGGDGHSVMVEEQAQPLPEESRPRRRRPPPVAPDAAPPVAPATDPAAPVVDPAAPAVDPTVPVSSPPSPAPAPAPPSPAPAPPSPAPAPPSPPT